MYPAGTARAFQYGLIIFTLTALLGLANATQIFGALDRNTLLTHLHSGTLGWITMGVFGVALALFSRNGMTVGPNVLLSAIATAAYVLAFWSGNFYARAIFGVVMLAVVFGWWAWVIYRAWGQGYGRLSTPQLSVALGLTTLVIGSTLGVIVQILYATNNLNAQNGVLIGVHASAQVGGYLILVGAGIAEWLLSPNGGRTRAGEVQSWALFLAGILLAVGFLTNLPPFILGSNVLQVVGVAFVAVRLGSRALGVGWGLATGARHAAMTVGFLVLGIALLVVLTQQFIAAQGDPTKVSAGLLHALDHSLFVGVMTNVLFASILTVSAGGPRQLPWADHVIFWGLNLGALSFIAVLLTVGSGEGRAAFTSPVAFTAPIMGLAALLGVVTFSMRLASAPTRQPAVAPA